MTIGHFFLRDRFSYTCLFPQPALVLLVTINGFPCLAWVKTAQRRALIMVEMPGLGVRNETPGVSDMLVLEDRKI